ncbi:MAG: hypothetical protein JWN15_519 [Firmicutes bacterium]|nr:hypothetical protein [Bacillota bacterium]
MRHRRLFWAAILLQVLVLVGMIGSHGYTLWTGRPVMLKTAPVDPWDPLRGEYVTLSYEISTLRHDQVAMNGAPYHQMQTVWVLLEQQGEFWSAVQVSDQRPAASPAQLAMRGTVAYYDGGVGRPGDVRVRYGIEQFYVPEGEARGLPGNGDRANMAVEVMVDSFGRAGLHRVYLEGQEIRWR